MTVEGQRASITITDEWSAEMKTMLEKQPRYLQVFATGRRWGKTNVVREFLGIGERDLVLRRFDRGSWR